jgi:hypothetical protein
MAESTDSLVLAHLRHLRASKNRRASKDRMEQRLDPVDA